MEVTAERATGKSVQLMATCLCDAFFDDVARATVEVLEHLGCEIEFPHGQTCCGQPAFNSGDWASGRTVMRHVLKTFPGNKPIIVPSGSCAAMLFHGALLEFEHESDLGSVQRLANRSWELIDFIVNGLEVHQWPGRYPGRVAFHRSCHTRGTCSGPAALELFQSIEGLEVVPFGESEQCCGFGGTFSVAFPHISSSMGRLKISHILETGVEMLVSSDMSCLMHMRGLAEKEGRPLRVAHSIQILRDALVNGGLLK
jgi:L-lactate dehydrogenase complex protein LldE